MKSPHCPRLATHITELRRVYRHLDKATIRDLIDHTGYAPWKHVTGDLLDEVDRLRDGIEAMCHRWRGSTNPALHMERELRALLNPTEGDDR